MITASRAVRGGFDRYLARRLGAQVAGVVSQGIVDAVRQRP
ncbi:hypothetical protein [Amycolatopsis vancoresmycina]|nr:hypothetical protein [Amycolatopsis vancoresmycina]